jgi:hypothetical protein
MGKRRVISVDAETGEILEGVPVWVGRKTAFTGLYGRQWFIMAQDAWLALAKDKELTLAPKNVLLYLLSQLDFENFIQVQQVDIAKALEMDKAKVSKAIKLLLEKGVLIRGPKLARSSSFRLNPNFGYKGNPSGKVYRTADGRRAFRVIDADGYVIPQEPAPDYPPKPAAPEAPEPARTGCADEGGASIE